MKPTKKCIEWWETNTNFRYLEDFNLAEHINSGALGRTMTGYFVFDDSFIDKEEAQEIYNQVQKEKIKLLESLKIGAYIDKPYGNEFIYIKEIDTRIEELKNECK